MNPDRIIAVRNNKTVFRDGDLCIKIFGSEFSKADILKEALNLAYAEETGLNTPKVKEVTVIDGKWAIVSEYIKGTPLDMLMHDNPEKLSKYMDMFINLQIQIHSTACRELISLKDKLIRKLDTAVLPDIQRDNFKQCIFSLPDVQNLCHGDFKPSNIIISEHGTPHILDWSHAALGSPQADAAQTYILLCLNGKTDDAELYLKGFCAHTKTDTNKIRSLLPPVAAVYSMRANEKERKILSSYINM